MMKNLCAGMVHLALNRSKWVAWFMTLTTLLVIAVAAVPSIWPEKFQQFHHITVDTDPENMLSQDEPVRVFHHEAKERFDLNDMVVVGIVNNRHPMGVFNAASLSRVYELTEFAKRLQWDGEGVISIDLIAPSTVDNIEQGGLGSVNFSWLMPTAPADDIAAQQVLERAKRIPFLEGTLVSEDGQALALYLPITKKELSYRIRSELLEFTKNWAEHGDEVHITGLPVAEDTFGVEMFIQMAISAPLAMLVIFLLLWWFFKKLILVVSPMIIAMVSSLVTMGLLIATGNTIHIMSSMIPIFIMPIAVLDAVHILSEFFDRYPIHKDRRKAIEEVMTTLFSPMLFTTLTTMAGFGSLMLTPIPPVQVFGLFIAIGVFLAWLWTMLFIPAYIMLIDEKRLEGYGHHVGEEDHSMLGRTLTAAGKLTTHRPRIILLFTLAAVVVAGYGISKIVVNDNPTRWFEAQHPIRVADRVLNDHFGGTYMAYLELSAPDQAGTVDKQTLLQQLGERQAAGEASGNTAAPYQQFAAAIEQADASTADSFMDVLAERAEQGLASASDDDYYSWDDIQLFLEEQQQRKELFKQPEALRWMEDLQAHLLDNPKVGKVNSLTDVVKTVYRELQLGEQSQFRIPDSANAVAQTLITYQNSHRPHDLWHFVTPDYRRTVLWLQLSSGDNKDMEAVVQSLNDFLTNNPPPVAIDSQWFGLTYINVVWQGKMVSGMLEAFLGSFLVVLVMMIVLFRSLILGVLAMIPLAVTVGLIYGIIGLIGKDYDMPVAVLSALSLGLAVDYAIHFLARSRSLVEEAGSWQAAVPLVFGEPARAISRNAIILGAGFLPLLAAPLVPYQTVGLFIASIILCAGAATLLILPAILTLMKKLIFKVEE